MHPSMEYEGTSRPLVSVSKHQDWHFILNLNPKRRNHTSEITRAAIAHVGVDLAKSVIQIHAVDAAGRRVVARSLKRDQFITWCVQLSANCVVAMEAGSSTLHFARKLKSMGLDARMMASNFVAPYRMEGKTGRNDAADAAAICEAASRPSMRYVPIKT